jgi:hypothetical protein
VLDHVIVGRPGFVSLRERGLYTPPELPPPQTLPSSNDDTATTVV